MHRSYSQLSNWLHCPHSYKLTKIQRIAERPSVWLPAGSAFHEAAEQFDRATYKLGRALSPLDPDADLTEFNALFDEHFEHNLDKLRQQEPDERKWRTAGRATQAKPHGEDVDWWRTAGQGMLQSYVRWRASTDERLTLAVESDGQPAIELEVSTTVGGVPMKGYLDRLFIDTSSGELIVVDLKSGSRMPFSPLQLALYSVQLGDRFGRPVVWGAYFNARKGELDTPIDLSIWTEDLLGTVFDQFDRAVQHGIFPPNIDTHCKGCGVREFCVYQGGQEPLQIAPRPPLQIAS